MLVGRLGFHTNSDIHHARSNRYANFFFFYFIFSVVFDKYVNLVGFCVFLLCPVRAPMPGAFRSDGESFLNGVLSTQPMNTKSKLQCEYFRWKVKNPCFGSHDFHDKCFLFPCWRM